MDSISIKIRKKVSKITTIDEFIEKMASVKMKYLESGIDHLINSAEYRHLILNSVPHILDFIHTPKNSYILGYLSNYEDVSSEIDKFHIYNDVVKELQKSLKQYKRELKNYNFLDSSLSNYAIIIDLIYKIYYKGYIFKFNPYMTLDLYKVSDNLLKSENNYLLFIASIV